MSPVYFLEKLLAIDSPTGFTASATEFIASSFAELGYKNRYTRKGALVCSPQNTSTPKLAFAAHTDTLGAIVCGVKPNGTLAFSVIGGPMLATFESSYVRIHTRSGKVYTGTLLLNNPSTHANSKAQSTERTADAMHIRVDERVTCADDVKGLGIGVGDIVAFETKFFESPSGYIKSFFLDNKVSCAVLFGVAQKASELGIDLPIEMFFSTYEEVGHGGAAGFSQSIEELLVLDMGVVGDACAGKETHVSICAKDSGGPYDYAFRQLLVNLAESNNIAYAVDVYPFYSSDGTAAWRAGLDVPVALIGPGVHASHGMERTHILGIEASIELCLAFIKHRFG